MYFLVNQDEIARTLARRLLIKFLKPHQVNWRFVKKIKKKFNRNTTTVDDIKNMVVKDMDNWYLDIKCCYKVLFKDSLKFVNKNFHQFEKFYRTHNQLSTHFSNYPNTGLVGIVGPQLDRHGIWITRNSYRDLNEPVLIRNIVNNESVIKERLSEQKEFWFLDSGYTNFLTPGRKPWHRLVKNHIHHNIENLSFPADRLMLLESFPRPWRTSGHKILVVENSEAHYDLFGTTLSQWRQQVQLQLSKYTDLPVEFRAKEPNKKIRSNLYQRLQNEDYYCVITDASAAAIEAIWCGIPVITLNRHISNSVSRQQLSDVNNLYRESLGDWLCALTYSQFTVEEFTNGTALKILKEYHHV